VGAQELHIERVFLSIGWRVLVEMRLFEIIALLNVEPTQTGIGYIAHIHQPTARAGVKVGSVIEYGVAEPAELPIQQMC
jgi:hypothetical protein